MISTAIAFFVVLFLTVRPLGTYLDDVFAGLGFLGEPHVNVLELNLALDAARE